MMWFVSSDSSSSLVFLEVMSDPLETPFSVDLPGASTSLYLQSISSSMAFTLKVITQMVSIEHSI